MPFVKSNDVDIYYEIHGEGEPLIFANGIFANTLSWFNQTKLFSKKYKVILYDMRGQGKSTKPKDHYSFSLHVEDQIALMDNLGIDRVHHIGISYGSELGLYFALKHPDRIKSLTLCCGVSFIGPYLYHVSQLWRLACILADPMLFFYATVPFNFSETYIKNNSVLLEQAKDRYKQFDYEAFTRLMDSFLQLNITNEELFEIKTPTCIIAGEKDRIKPPNPYSMTMHENIPNSELHIVPDSGHVVTWEKPHEFNSIVLGFLEKNLMN
ncbi:MAG: alpha/beta fold hydrolase [Candidatus Hodarchaeales archaeon]